MIWCKHCGATAPYRRDADTLEELIEIHMFAAHPDKIPAHVRWATMKAGENFSRDQVNVSR
jgi:hypothetical protein